VWGIAGATTGSNQLIYKYDLRRHSLNAIMDVSSPPLLARVSVSRDGSAAMIGWAMFGDRALLGRAADRLRWRRRPPRGDRRARGDAPNP